MTRCGYTEPRLRALLDGELSGSETRKVVTHLDPCRACRAEYSRLQMARQ